MSYNICSLSGKITSNPVICTKTGYIFDKDLIMNYIENFGNCPITNIPLTKDDFDEIENSEININKPRTIEEMNVNGLLSNLNEQFINIQNEISELKQKIIERKKELSVQCYKYDASINVINQLIKEKEELKKNFEM
jgi:pre-mRNA-processing factor 19